MRGQTAACFIVVIALALVRVLAAGRAGPWWGLNAFGYVSSPGVVIFVAGGLLLMAAALWAGNRRRAEQKQIKPLLTLLPGLAVIALFLFYPAATPLLGDGLERIEATPAGFKIIADRSAPLSLAVNVLVFKAGAGLFEDSFAWSWKVWRLTSYLAGALYFFLAWKLAALRARSRMGRGLIFLSLITVGYLLLFMGYAETYPLLAAAILGYIVLIELVEQRAAPRWSLAAAFVVLVGLHYFMILLAPALLVALHRRRVWSPGPKALVFIASALCLAGAILAYVVSEYYRGLAAIFMPPDLFLGKYHLIGFFNQQMLAAPAWPLLLVLAIMARPAKEGGLLDSFLGLASITMLAFFLFLKPLIGPAADWDLFAIPAMFYVPWLTLRILRGAPEKIIPLAPAAIGAVFLIAVIPWLQLNAKEDRSLTRFRELMEWESGYNKRTASYGYYRLGKYLARFEPDPERPETVAALRRAVEINPDYAALRQMTARVFMSVGERDVAREQMAGHHRLMAEYYVGKQRWDDAAAQYEKAIGYAPNDGALIGKMIELWEGPLGDHEKAELYREKLKRLGGDGAPPK